MCLMIVFNYVKLECEIDIATQVDSWNIILESKLLAYSDLVEPFFFLHLALVDSLKDSSAAAMGR